MGLASRHHISGIDTEYLSVPVGGVMDFLVWIALIIVIIMVCNDYI